MKNELTRLNKFMAECGIGSRRQCDKLIAEKHVRINGKIVLEQGIRIDPEKDKVTVNKTVLSIEKETKRTIILHKPRGYICSASSKQGQTVYALIQDIKERLVPVGRLDKNSEGLILMSNNGELVNQLTHPSFQNEKTYHVTVSGNVDSAVLVKLRSRLTINDYKIQPCKVKILRESNNNNRLILEFILKEGRNRQIREMCRLANLAVRRLVRVQIGTLKFKGLKVGQWRNLTEAELKNLLKHKTRS